MIDITKALVLIDGEHYISVIKSAIQTIIKELDYEVLAAIFLGGTEKSFGKEEFELLDVPVVYYQTPLQSIRKALTEYNPEVVIDLSDEPVVGYKERFLIASHLLSKGISYIGADFRFDAPKRYDISKKPSISIIGTGKRVGKTAISGYCARLLSKTGIEPVIVAMGRGGPTEPEVMEGDKINITPEYLLEQSNSGKHAASDYFEDALTSRVKTVGCRRCGGGMAGAPFVTNMLKGVLEANKLGGDVTILEGSGSTIPPVQTERTILVVGANQSIEYIAGYFGVFRVLISDLVIMTMCEEPVTNSEKIRFVRDRIKKIKPGIQIVPTVFRPSPLESIEGEKVFVAMTSSTLIREKIKEYLEEKHKCEVVGFSNNLSNRELLRDELKVYEGKYSAILTELKAAAVDVVTRVGLEAGIRVVYFDNVPIEIGKRGKMEKDILDVSNEAVRLFREKEE